MALNNRALHGTLIRALAALIAAFTLIVVGCASNPGGGEETPDTNDNPTCTKAINGQCVQDSGAETTSPDTGTNDTATTPPADSGVVDSSDDTNVQPDTGSDDTGSAMDSGSDAADTTPQDTGVVTTDSGAPDTTPADTGTIDSGTPDTGTADSGTPDTGTPDTGTTYTKIGCDAPVEEKTFPSFKINGTNDVEMVGGIWGTSANDYYIPVSGYGAEGSPAAVAHWTGSSYVQENLINNDGLLTTKTTSIWGDSSGNVFVTAVAGKGRLYQRKSGTWVEDTTVPTMSNFNGMAGSYLVGNVYGDLQVWKHVGSSWVQMSVPSFANGSIIHKLHWIDDAHAYIAGCVDKTGSGGCTDPLLLAVNGNAWVDLTPVMSDAVELYDVNGSLTNGLYITGMGRNSATASGWQAVAYQLDFTAGGALKIVNTIKTASMSVSTSSHVFAKGLFVTGGQDQVLALGSGRVTQVGPMDPPTTFSAGTASYGVNQFWQEPGSNKVHYVNYAAPSNVARHYVMTCSLSY
jgi:hypothetical protein